MLSRVRLKDDESRIITKSTFGKSLWSGIGLSFFSSIQFQRLLLMVLGFKCQTSFCYLALRSIMSSKRVRLFSQHNCLLHSKASKLNLGNPLAKEDILILNASPSIKGKSLNIQEPSKRHRLCRFCQAWWFMLRSFLYQTEKYLKCFIKSIRICLKCIL